MLVVVFLHNICLVVLIDDISITFMLITLSVMALYDHVREQKFAKMAASMVHVTWAPTSLILTP